MGRNHTAHSHAPVAIVGAGPVGLSLALGFARQGVRSVLLEQKRTTSQTSKAPALHVRTRDEEGLQFLRVSELGTLLLRRRGVGGSRGGSCRLLGQGGSPGQQCGEEQR